MTARPHKLARTTICLAAFLGLAAGCAHDPSVRSTKVHRANYVPMSHHYLEYLEALAHDPVVVHNVEHANETNNLSADEIREIDEAWVAAGTSRTNVMSEVLENDAAAYLRRISDEHPEFVELFLIDRKGCVTAENVRTTDYWQGDEAKWTKVFNENRGEYFVDDIEFDLSTRRYVHHYSIPIRDSQNRLIGVLAAGVAADALSLNRRGGH